MTGRVCGLGRRLANDRQSSRPAPCRLGMPVGQLGLDIDQLSGRDEMPGDNLGQVFGQPTELGLDASWQRPGIYVGRQTGLIGTPLQSGRRRSALLALRRPVVPGLRAAPVLVTRPISGSLLTTGPLASR